VRNNWKQIEKQRFGGLWALPDITGSVNVVDINLPRIALEAQREEHRFWELYDERLKLVREALEWQRERYVRLMKQYPNFYAMILEYMHEFPSSHFNTIGIIGLPEAAALLMQEPKLWLDGARRDWLRAAELMRKMVEYATSRAREWMMETGVPWNVEEVPGESAAPKLALRDMKLYPELAEYLPAEPLYSTSVAPYYAEMELPDRIEVEQRVQKYFTGGVMMHLFLAEEPDPEALAKLAKRIMETDIVYWSFTPAITHCNNCDSTFTGLYRACLGAEVKTLMSGAGLSATTAHSETGIHTAGESSGRDNTINSKLFFPTPPSASTWRIHYAFIYSWLEERLTCRCCRTPDVYSLALRL